MRTALLSRRELYFLSVDLLLLSLISGKRGTSRSNEEVNVHLFCICCTKKETVKAARKDKVPVRHTSEM